MELHIYLKCALADLTVPSVNILLSGVSIANKTYFLFIKCSAATFL